MANTLTNFSRLPPELRLHTWNLALTSEWSCTNFHRVKRRIKISGKTHHRAISRACREARQAMEAKFTQVRGLGWFDFDRHLFFFRDVEASRGLMKCILDRHDLIPHIRHVLINPRGQPELIDTIKLLIKTCTSIRTIVAVAPWSAPYRPGRFNLDQDLINPYETWSRVICKSPTELDLASLLDAIKHRGKENDACIAQYRVQLSQDVDRLPDVFPVGFQAIDHKSWRNRQTLDRLQNLCKESITSPSPKLFLRTVEEVCNPRTIESVWADLRNA